jgi:anti-sigma factor RsiW
MPERQPLNETEREYLSAYLDGELDAKSRRSLEERLSLDAHARREMDTLRRTWDMLEYLPRPEPSADFTHRTLERLATLEPSSPSAAGRNWRGWSFGAGWAAALLLAAVAGFEGMRYHQRPVNVAVDEQLVQELPLIENARLYEHVDDLDFLHQLANPNDPDLFGDDSIGS